MKFETIRERYLSNYIRDDQLLRFKTLGIITEEEYAKLYAEKHPVEQEAMADETLDSIKE